MNMPGIGTYIARERNDGMFADKIKILTNLGSQIKNLLRFRRLISGLWDV